MKKKIIIACAFIGVVLVLYFVFFNKPKEQAIITATVKKQNLTQSVEAVGEVFAQNLVDVGAQASGQIKELYVKVGDKVKKGDKIAQIDQVTQQNKLDQQLSMLESLNAKLNSANISYEVAKQQYQREQKLAEFNASSKENLENYKNSFSLAGANLKEIKAQIAQTKIEIETAKTNLGYTNITAPLDGTIVSVPVEIGQTINAVQSTPTVVNIADLTKMEIKMKISEGDITKIKVGNEVIYSVLSETSKKLKGKISSIDPGLTTLSDGGYSSSSNSNLGSSSSAVYYYAKVKIDNDDEFLRIGMTTQNTIIVNQIKDAIVVPTLAIRTDEEGSFVLIKDKDTIQKARVEVGITTDINTQIISGLNEGQVVVLSQISNDEINAIIGKTRARMRL
nr:efflux RND transporter periplasmic adaptor subunit [Campylobacter sp.]